MSPLITGVAATPIAGAVVEFVDSITDTAGIRLDLNDLSPFMVTSLDLSPPSFRRATSGSMLSDGERITASAYGNRTIKLVLELATDTAYDAPAAAIALSALARELDRPRNILRVSLGNTDTYYRTYRSPDFVLAMLNGNIDYSRQDITLVAEPFGLTPPVSLTEGPREDVSTFFANDVRGDVESPLQIIFPGDLGGHRMMISSRRGGDPDSLVPYLKIEAEDISRYPWVSLAASYDPNMSGGGPSPNYVTVDFSAYAPGTPIGTVTASPFGSVTADARGRYRVFLRYRKNTFAGVGDITLQASYGGQLTKPFVTAGVTTPQLVDLGLFSAPGGPDPVEDGYSGVTMPVLSQDLGIVATRNFGSGSLDLDYLLLQPADDCCTVIDWSHVSNLDNQNVVDGPAKTVYSAVINDFTGAKIVLSSAHKLRSAVPMVSPGMKNRFWVLPQINSPYSGDDVNATVPVTDIVYWPRYLTLAT